MVSDSRAAFINVSALKCCVYSRAAVNQVSAAQVVPYDDGAG